MQIDTKALKQKYYIISLFCCGGILMCLLTDFIQFFLNHKIYKSSHEITYCMAKNFLEFLAFPVCLSLYFYN